MKIRVLLAACFFTACLSLLPGLLTAQALYEAKKDSAKVPRQPYLRYFTKDRYGRQITFYLTEMAADTKLPLIVYVQGSGANSNFILNNGRIIPVNGHIYIYESLQGRARLLVVEKPGVNYLDNPAAGDIVNNKEFNRQHSLEKWAEAIEASILACLRAGLADSSRVAVIGHSEGGLVACRVAADLRSLVTHVACLAGGGDTQLYDIIALARKGNFFSNISGDSTGRVAYVLEEWKKIAADPLNTEKFFFGFSYLRWSSFLKTSPAAELEKVSAKIFIAQGLKDENLDPISADMLYAHLLSRNKNVKYDRLENADHSFNEKDNPAFNGWKAEMEKIIKWLLE